MFDEMIKSALARTEPIILRVAERDGKAYMRAYEAIPKWLHSAQCNETHGECICTPLAVYALGDVILNQTVKVSWLVNIGKVMARFGVVPEGD